MSLKFALIGCGRIARKHAELLGENNIKGACLAAVCDIDIQKAKFYGEKYNVPFFDNYNNMLTNIEIDVAVVLTESGNHAKHVIEIAQFGKDIIVEKPMALTIDDADNMIEECTKNNCKLFVVKQNRYNLPIIKLKEAIRKGDLGDIFLGTVRVRWCRDEKYYKQAPWRGTWKLDGGVLTNQAIHHIDLLTWLVDSKVDSVFAKGIRAMADIEAEDTAAVILKFRNGAIGIIEATTAVRPKDLEGSISILGSKGNVEVGGFAANKIIRWDLGQQTEDIDTLKEENSENPPNVYGFGHKAYYEDVVRTIKESKLPPIGGSAGRKNVELLSAIYESMETRKEVFLRFKPEKCKLGSRL